MKALVESPRRESIRCSSWEVPSVEVTSTWVSPRVKMADPWVRGSTRIWQSMGRMSVSPRPSIRRFSERIFPRTIFFSRSWKADAMSVAFSRRSSSEKALRTASALSSILFRRSCLALLAGGPVCLPFHRQDRVPAAGDEDAHVAPRQVGNPGVDDQLPVDPPDAGARDGAFEGDLGEGGRRGGADHGEHRGVVLLVGRKNRGDDLDLVVEPFREEGPDRPVDQPRGEDLELGQPSLPLEETARDLPDCEGLLHITGRKREEIEARARRLGGARGPQAHGAPGPT